MQLCGGTVCTGLNGEIEDSRAYQLPLLSLRFQKWHQAETGVGVRAKNKNVKCVKLTSAVQQCLGLLEC